MSLALLEVATEQRLDDRILHALLLGEPDQAMGVEGVRRPPHQVMPELDPIRRADCGDPGVELLRVLQRAELAAAIVARSMPSGGICGFSSNGRQWTSTVTSSGSLATAASKRRLPT